MLDIKRVLAAKPRPAEKVELNHLSTKYGETLDESRVLPEHPHPQFCRDSFFSLNGWWEYAIVRSADAASAWRDATPPQQFDGQILVPFSPEATLSGVTRQLQPDELLWYRLRLDARGPLGEKDPQGLRRILHFEAVDYACSVWIGDTRVGEHVGGYLPFSFDVTDALAKAWRTGAAELLLCVYDPSEKGTQLRGKQQLERRDIWYTAQSGIWQGVWAEEVPEAHILSASVVPDLDGEALYVALSLSCPGEVAHVRIHGGGIDEQATLEAADDTADLALRVDSPRPWSPDDPFLYDLELAYGDDVVRSYCAFRTVAVEEDESGVPRFFLNHEPLFLRGVLDQGYWPDGLMTAPADEALVDDVLLARDLGFNMVRKHIKIESDRWYYHCDRLGMLVWQDAVSGGGTYELWTTSYMPTLFSASWGAVEDGKRSRKHMSAADEAYRDEWVQTAVDMVRYLGNHPCIVTWVLFNEGWGQFDAREATALVDMIDPTRPVDSTSGWFDQRTGDYLSIHNYFRPLEVARAWRPKAGRALVFSEFGGLSYHVDGHSALDKAYGYESYDDIEAFRAAVRARLDTVDALEPDGLSGYVYTHLYDIEEEVNGLVTFDRKVNKLR